MSTLLDPIASIEKTLRTDPPPSWDAARRQAALVRTLTDELERHAALGATEAIRDQLTEEVARLASHMEETSVDLPDDRES